MFNLKILEKVIIESNSSTQLLNENVKCLSEIILTKNIEIIQTLIDSVNDLNMQIKYLNENLINGGKDNDTKCK